jgi:hypothetical protein
METLLSRFYVPFSAGMGTILSVSVLKMFVSYFHIYSVMFLQQLCIFDLIKQLYLQS